MYHKLKMTMLSAHALSRKKLGADIHRDSPLLTHEETGTSFQCSLLNDATLLRLINQSFKGFRLKKEYIEMSPPKFLEFLNSI